MRTTGINDAMNRRATAIWGVSAAGSSALIGVDVGIIYAMYHGFINSGMLQADAATFTVLFGLCLSAFFAIPVVSLFKAAHKKAPRFLANAAGNKPETVKGVGLKLKAT